MRISSTLFRCRYRCLLCALLIMLVGASPAVAQPSQKLKSKAADAEALVLKAGRPGGVRVVITLNGATPGPDTLPLPSPFVETPAERSTAGPMGDGQSATVEQARIIARYLGSD